MITADDMAARRETINYEVVCDFGLRLQKIYV
jgi:alanine racemase